MENNKESEIQGHIVVAGKTINEPMTIDGGKFCGNTVVAGGTVTILSQASFVSDCIVSSGGVIDVQEGMVLDCIIDDGGKLIVGDRAVHNNILVKSGGECVVKSAEGIEAWPGAIVTTPKANTSPASADKPQEEEEIPFRCFIRTDMLQYVLDHLARLFFRDHGDSDVCYHLNVKKIGCLPLDQPDCYMLSCYGDFVQEGEAVDSKNIVLKPGSYLKFYDFLFATQNENGMMIEVNEQDLPGFIECSEIRYSFVVIPHISCMLDRCEKNTIYLELIVSDDHEKILSHLSRLEFTDHGKKYYYMISSIKTLRKSLVKLYLQLTGKLYDATYAAVSNDYIADDDSEFKFVAFNEDFPVSSVVRITNMIFYTGPKSYGIHIPEIIIHEEKKKNEETDMEQALKDDAASSQFNGVTPDMLDGEDEEVFDDDNDETQAEMDKDHEEELHNMLVDHHNRTRLVIRAKCNYDCVLESISFFMFRYEEHTFTLDPELSDEVFETDDENDIIRIYIKHLPRMDVDDYDLVLTDIVFDDATPEELRFGIIDADYEDAAVDINLSPAHDEHLYEIEDNPVTDDINDCNSIIVLRGELCGQCVNSWSNGELVIARGDEKYYVHEKEGSRQASISTSDLSFKMIIHPDELKGFDGEIVTGDDVYPILHHSTMIGWENAEPDALLRFTSYEADGLSLPVKIPAQGLIVAIEGYSEDKVNIFSTIKVRRDNESFEEYTLVDKDDERRIYYDSDTHHFRIVTYPRFVLDKNNKKIVGEDMVKLVKDCLLTGFVPMHDIGDACIEISTFSVDGVHHAINLLNENSRRFKVFKYHKVTKEIEKDSCDPAEPVFTKASVVPDNKNQSIIDPKLRVIKLCGKYQCFLPRFSVILTIKSDTGTERYRLWAGSTDHDFDQDTDDVTITFKDILFTCGDKKIMTPLATIGREFDFSIESDVIPPGKFLPLYLVWGNMLQYEFK